MPIIVTDAGFTPESETPPFLDLAPDTDPGTLDATTNRPIRITFASFADGRGFTLARLLRLRGYTGRLRAAGHVIADQYAMARRAGFDEVEISPELAQRQDAAQWRVRADWQTLDHQARLRG